MKKVRVVIVAALVALAGASAGQAFMRTGNAKSVPLRFGWSYTASGARLTCHYGHDSAHNPQLFCGPPEGLSPGLAVFIDISAHQIQLTRIGNGVKVLYEGKR